MQANFAKKFQMNFEALVLERSQTIPVVVDFWAAWCGPCRVLGPVIEKLADEANGRWELVKIDTEAHPHLMQVYKIQGIPAVKMFFKGNVIAEFTGALPAQAILKWLDENLPSPEKSAWLDFRSRNIWPLDSKAFHEFEENAANWQHLDDAREALMKMRFLFKPDAFSDIYPKLGLNQEIYVQASQIWAKPLAVEFEEERTHWKTSNWEALVELLLAKLMPGSQERETARKVLIALFDVFGHQHPITKKYQRRFSMLLFG